MRYISDLRRKIRNLEIEAAELSQRLNMLLVDQDVTRAQNNYLRLFVQAVEHQLQLQYALNLSLQEEIRHLKQLTTMEPHRVSINLFQSEQSTSQSGDATNDHDKPEPEGK
ncbi:hypothetical protein WN944_003208 [Citrus x changshan-huyou]|uniref:Uncharacterized protein n=1 Tax=Citrus x changshan-huyou TaxID=2935761 RepID=A0AAP0M173_9ROSI